MASRTACCARRESSRSSSCSPSVGAKRRCEAAGGATRLADTLRPNLLGTCQLDRDRARLISIPIAVASAVPVDPRVREERPATTVAMALSPEARPRRTSQEADEHSPAHRLREIEYRSRPSCTPIAMRPGNRRWHPAGGIQPVACNAYRSWCAMTPLEIGAWFLVPESLIRQRSGRQGTQSFASKPGRRPVILASNGAGSVSTVVPRSTRRQPGPEPSCLHDGHDHRRAYPDCCIDADGRVVYLPVPLRDADLVRYGPKCTEPDNTGLMERIERWMSI